VLILGLDGSGKTVRQRSIHSFSFMFLNLLRNTDYLGKNEKPVLGP